MNILETALQRRDAPAGMSAAAPAARRRLRVDPAAALRALRRLSSRLGQPGVAAIGVLVACAAFYGSAIAPQAAAIDEARGTVQTLLERIRAAKQGQGDDRRPLADQLAEFHRLLPQEAQLPDQIDRIYELARLAGLALPQGDYQASEDKQGRLLRYQLVLPVQGDYPRIREFLAALAAEVPAAALERIGLERQKVGDPLVTATIRLNLYLERQP